MKSPKRLSLAAASGRREFLDRLVDPAQMLPVFRHELPRLTSAAIRVTSCKANLRRRRVAMREERLEILYQVGIEEEGGPERMLLLLGTAPETAEFSESLHPEILGHPALEPFRVPVFYVDGFRLGLRFFPLDPALPALAALTGPQGHLLVAPHLGGWRNGAALERIECELRQYKPFKRAVLRITALLADGRARVLYAKLFADPRGERSYRELASLWSATRGARGLRMPEPLGYDSRSRVLFLGEAPGRCALNEWIGCLERDLPLPPGVDLARLERCMALAAQTIADLQDSGVRPQRTRSGRSVLAGLHRDRAALCAKLPGNEALREVGDLLARLEGLAGEEETLVPSHGCFRHKQMVGDESCLSVVDWDGLCRASAAMDAATFLGRLRREPLRRPGQVEALEHLAATFRREFLACRPGVPAQALAVQEAVVVVEDLLRSFRRPSRGTVMGLEIAALASAVRAQLAGL